MRRNKNFIQYRLIPFLFLTFLLLPTANDYFHFIPEVTNTENRVMYKKPEFDISKLDQFPQKYEIYFNDHFSFRNQYNKLVKESKYQYLNINPLQDKVIIGKHNWMFHNNNMLPNKRGKNSFSDEELIDLRKELLARDKFFKEHNCKYYLVIIPTKAIVYKDSLPNYYQRMSFTSVKTNAKQLVDYMKNDSLSIIDLASKLKAKKNDNQIFLKYDHHWNQLGAFFACQNVLDEISNDFPFNVNSNIRLSDYWVDYKETTLGVQAAVLGLSEYFVDNEPWLRPKNDTDYVEKLLPVGYKGPENFTFINEFEERFATRDSASLFKCMVIRDSFAQYYTKFLSRGFSETVYIWDNWQYKINKEIFLKEKPSIFITMILDKHLGKLIDNKEFEVLKN